jgi:hypothetical protein
VRVELSTSARELRRAAGRQIFSREFSVMSSGKKRSNRKPTPPPTPKQLKPWDPPPFPAKGDQDVRNTYEWIGRALTEWESFEANFGAIFGILVGDPNIISPAMRAYGSVLTFRGRVDMTTAAAKAFFTQHPNQASYFFETIKEEAIGYAMRRNEIAHGIVQLYYPRGKKADGTVLGPSRFATSKQKLTWETGQFPFKITPTYAYASAELMIFTRDFHSLAQRTHGYQHNLFLEARKLRQASP